MDDPACHSVDGGRRWANGLTRPVDRPAPVRTPPEERCLRAIRPDDAKSAPSSVHPACDIVVPAGRAKLCLDEVDAPPRAARRVEKPVGFDLVASTGLRAGDEPGLRRLTRPGAGRAAGPRVDRRSDDSSRRLELGDGPVAGVVTHEG